MSQIATPSAGTPPVVRPSLGTPTANRPLRPLAERGIVIVDCTQCLRGAVNLNAYATGAALLQAGVISGADMTPIAALTKLHYLIGSGYASDEVRALMQENLCGELTPQV